MSTKRKRKAKPEAKGASMETLIKRLKYNNRKGRSAARRIREHAKKATAQVFG